MTIFFSPIVQKKSKITVGVRNSKIAIQNDWCLERFKKKKNVTTYLIKAGGWHPVQTDLSEAKPSGTIKSNTAVSLGLT